jgi:catechol 2,3-dioxygenase-like lactoylglutathione lyase family enzyme
MLNIESVNHVGIRIGERGRSVLFYQLLGFEQTIDAGFEDGHPIIMVHPSGVTINLLGPARVSDGRNILMDVDDKYPGYTHVALTVGSLELARTFLETNKIAITGSFGFGTMSAIFIRDPDGNVIELDAYGDVDSSDAGGYAGHS